MKLGESMKGDVRWVVVVIVTTALATLSIGLTMGVVSGIAKDSGMSEDTNQMGNLADSVKSKCSDAEKVDPGELKPTNKEINLKVAEELRKSSEGVEVVFDDTARPTDLGENCVHRFENIPMKGQGVHEYNISYVEDDGDKPVIEIKELE